MNKERKNAMVLNLNKNGIFLGDVQINWEDALTLKSALETQYNTPVSSFKQLIIKVDSADFLLIPNEFQDDLYTLGLMEIGLGENALKGKEIHSNFLKNLDSFMNFAIPSNWKDMMALELPMTTLIYEHGLTEKLKNLNKEDILAIYYYENFIYVLLQLNGKLELVNYFEFQSSLELSFYLHSIRESYQLNFYSPIVNHHGLEKLDEEFIKELKELNILSKFETNE